MKHLYKYPQGEYPYNDLLVSNQNRNRLEPENELLDTGLFDNNKYFDVFTEYARNNGEDICIKITMHNRANEAAFIAALPTLWLRNLWSFGAAKHKPAITETEPTEAFGHVKMNHHLLGDYHFYFDAPKRTLFTENETNTEKLYNQPNATPFVKDTFHTAVVQNNYEAFKEKNSGTKFSPMYEFDVEAQSSVTIKLKLSKDVLQNPFYKKFEENFSQRIAETDEFYNSISNTKDEDEKNIQRQAFAGMLWSKQYFNIDIPRWLNGDPGQPAPPADRKTGRNHQWMTLNNEDIVSMPDKWEYPWYAA
jgi:hypothetical protein